MGLYLRELQGGASGCRSAAILPSGSFNSLQLDTFKKLLILYGKLSISAVLATVHLVYRLPLAIKLFLSDYLLSQTGWSLWSGVRAVCSKGACAKVRQIWVLLTGSISWRCGERVKAAWWVETTRCSEQENLNDWWRRSGGGQGRQKDRDWKTNYQAKELRLRKKWKKAFCD